MTTSFVYPASAELEEIAQDKLPVLQEARPIFQIMPTESVDAHLLEWEIEDNWTGLQQLRGLGGDFARVKKTGLSRFMMTPGAYGEFIDIDEQELTTRRKYGTFGDPVDISDLVMRAQDRLLLRRLDRIEYIGWKLLQDGTFSVASDTGVIHGDSYSVQSYGLGDGCSDWYTASSATPLQDFRNVQLKARGHSVNFGASARAYMNQVTANKLLANTNSADLYGRRTEGLGTFNSVGQLNMLLAGDGLPQISVYDDGYLDDTGTFVQWIADGKVVVVGVRPGNAPIANYRYTRNANNANMAPGPFQRVVDSGDEGKPPRRIDVYDGHNGGPVVFYPSAVVMMTVH